MTSTTFVPETFTPDESAALSPYFSNIDSPVFVIKNLPEVVKGALFARYSRSAKSLRRLFLDEFLDSVFPRAANENFVGTERANRLYERVFHGYGDDSVAQLGGAHIACEGVSNVLTKVLERGRLMSYLEQSTRYVPYTERPGGRWKYVVPREIVDARVRTRYSTLLDQAFQIYEHWIEPVQEYFRTEHPNNRGDSESVYRTAIRSKTLDTLRGLLPAATRSNVGIFGSGQAFEALLIKMRSHALKEAQDIAELMLAELRTTIPAFLTRVDLQDRGQKWGQYLRDCQKSTRTLADQMFTDTTSSSESEVVLTEFDPEAEIKVVAAALYGSSNRSEIELLSIARSMSTEERICVLRAYVGDRTNRRYRPGRAFERTSYCFDILSDYGAFRDLQRHRMLSLEWQSLSSRHGYTQPSAIAAVGATNDWHRVMAEAASLHELLTERYGPTVAQYPISMAYRIRFYMHMNAREAMHVIELRTAPQGHPAYRRVCQQMHKLIENQAGHKALAAAMTFADHSQVELERLDAERAKERKQSQNRITDS